MNDIVVFGGSRFGFLDCNREISELFYVIKFGLKIKICIDICNIIYKFDLGGGGEFIMLNSFLNFL